MYISPIILDVELSNILAKLNESDCLAAIKILRDRLAILRKPDYYLSINADDLHLSTRAHNVLKIAKLNTVWDIMECGYDSIALLPNAGPQTVSEIRNKIERLIAHKNDIRGLTGQELARKIDAK